MNRKQKWRRINELIEQLQYKKSAGSERDFHIYQAVIDLLRMHRKELADSNVETPYR
jgi:hypothetical protein